MIISFKSTGTMKRATAFMVKGEKVDIVALAAVRGGALFATVRDESGQTDYVDSAYVAFKPVRSKSEETEAQPESLQYTKGI